MPLKSPNAPEQGQSFDYQVGDWVRFYANGELVIGVIEYVRKKEFEPMPMLLTTHGEIKADRVVERRRR